MPRRTPEGEPLRCPVCGKANALEVAIDYRDATCPACGVLLRSETLRALGWEPPFGAADVANMVELMQRAQAGDRDALDQLFKLCYERLRRSVRTKIGHASRARMVSKRDVALEKCLEQLAEPHRMVIVLRDFDGLAWNEVAKKMGKDTDSAARELYRCALLELAHLMRRRGMGPDWE